MGNIFSCKSNLDNSTHGNSSKLNSPLTQDKQQDTPTQTKPSYIIPVHPPYQDSIHNAHYNNNFLESLVKKGLKEGKLITEIYTNPEVIKKINEINYYWEEARKLVEEEENVKNRECYINHINSHLSYAKKQLKITQSPDEIRFPPKKVLEDIPLAICGSFDVGEENDSDFFIETSSHAIYVKKSDRDGYDYYVANDLRIEGSRLMEFIQDPATARFGKICHKDNDYGLFELHKKEKGFPESNTELMTLINKYDINWGYNYIMFLCD